MTVCPRYYVLNVFNKSSQMSDTYFGDSSLSSEVTARWLMMLLSNDADYGTNLLNSCSGWIPPIWFATRSDS